MNKTNAVPTFATALPHGGFEQLMEADNSDDRILNQQENNVDGADPVQDYSDLDFLPFTVPQSSSTLSAASSAQPSQCNLSIPSLSEPTSDNLVYGEAFSQTLAPFLPYDDNIDRTALVGDGGLTNQLQADYGAGLTNQNQIWNSSGQVNGSMQMVNGNVMSDFFVKSGVVNNSAGSQGMEHSIVPKLSYSDLYALCQKQKKDLYKKDVRNLNMRKLIIEEQQVIANIRRKRDEAVADVSRCKEGYQKLYSLHQQLQRDNEKIKSEFISNKLIVQQLEAKVSHLVAENKLLHIQISSNSDPEKIKLKDEVKELNKLQKKNEKTISMKTETIQDLRNTLATVQALPEIMKHIANNKNRSKENDLVTASSSMVEDALNQKQMVPMDTLKTIMNSFKSEMYLLVKNLKDSVPQVKVKTKSIFDASDTEDSETANIRSCISSTPSYDEELFDDNFAMSSSSGSPPFNEDLVVSTIETDALSRGEYTKTSISLGLESIEPKNAKNSVRVDLNQDSSLYEDQMQSPPPLVPQNSSGLINANLRDSEPLSYDKNGVKDRKETMKFSGIPSEKYSDVSKDLKPSVGAEGQHKYKKSSSLTTLPAKIKIDREESSKSYLNSDSINFGSTQVNITSNPKMTSVSVSKTSFPSKKTKSPCSLSESDSDNCVSPVKSPSRPIKGRTFSKFSPGLPDLSPVAEVKDSVILSLPAINRQALSESSGVRNSSPVAEVKDGTICKSHPALPDLSPAPEVNAVIGQKSTVSPRKGGTHSRSDVDDSCTDSEDSDSSSASDGVDDSESFLSSEDETEVVSTNSKSKVPPVPLSEVCIVNVKNTDSIIKTIAGYSLSEDLNLSSDSDMSEDESNSEPADSEPSIPAYKSTVEMPQDDFSSVNSVVSDVIKVPVMILPDLTIKDDTVSEAFDECEELPPCKVISVDGNDEQIPTSVECVSSSPEKTMEENRSTESLGTVVASEDRVATLRKKIGVGKLPEKKSGFLRPLVSKTSSIAGVNIPSRTPTLPSIFRRQPTVEVSGIKRSLPSAVSNDLLEDADCRPAVQETSASDDITVYETPAKKIRVSLFEEPRKKMCNAEPAGVIKKSAVIAVTECKDKRETCGTLPTAVKEKDVVQEASKLSGILNSAKSVASAPTVNKPKEISKKPCNTIPPVPKGKDELKEASKLTTIINSIKSAPPVITTNQPNEIPRPSDIKMSAKDRIKNSMSDIIQIGSGENMCDKKKLEIKAQRTIERMKAEKQILKESSNDKESFPPVKQLPAVIRRTSARNCEKSVDSVEEAFLKTAPNQLFRRMPGFKPNSSSVSKSKITARVAVTTKTSVSNKDKNAILKPQVPTRTSPRRQNLEKVSPVVAVPPKKKQRVSIESASNNATKVLSSPSLPNKEQDIITEDQIFNEMFQELANKSVTKNHDKCSKQAEVASTAVCKDNAEGNSTKKSKPPPVPPKNVNLTKLIVGNYARSLTTDELFSIIQKQLPELIEQPPSEIHIAQKIYYDLQESISSYMLRRIDEQSLIIGCKKLCSTIGVVKSLLPKLYPNLDSVAVTFFMINILGRLCHLFNRNDILNMLGLCYGTICREFNFIDLAHQILYLVIVKRTRQKCCFAQGFISGYPDMFSSPFENGSILEKSIVISLTCGPLYCDSIYYKEMRHIFADGIGVVLPDLNFKHFFAYIWKDFKELEFQKSIEDGEKALVMLLLQCDWQQSMLIIEDNFDSIYKEWKERKITDMIFLAFLKIILWANELTIDSKPQFLYVQSIFGRLKDAHTNDQELLSGKAKGPKFNENPVDLFPFDRQLFVLMAPLRQFIEDGFVKSGKLAERGPYSGPELFYYNQSDMAEHAQIKSTVEKVNNRRVKRIIRGKEGRRKKIAELSSTVT